MRGEYGKPISRGEVSMELPPHARRILERPGAQEHPHGTTSACAENTYQPVSPHGLDRNYLRMRGEYGKPISRGEVSMELPPHARRILERPGAQEHPHGTTSACAENTYQPVSPHGLDRNYLRVRGEYVHPVAKHVQKTELPPRARRIRHR